jgi:hypothetical protein
VLVDGPPLQTLETRGLWWLPEEPEVPEESAAFIGAKVVVVERF